LHVYATFDFYKRPFLLSPMIFSIFFFKILSPSKNDQQKLKTLNNLYKLFRLEINVDLGLRYIESSDKYVPRIFKIIEKISEEIEKSSKDGIILKLNIYKIALKSLAKLFDQKMSICEYYFIKMDEERQYVPDEIPDVLSLLYDLYLKISMSKTLCSAFCSLLDLNPQKEKFKDIKKRINSFLEKLQFKNIKDMLKQ